MKRLSFLSLMIVTLLFANSCKDDNEPKTKNQFPLLNSIGDMDLISNFDRPNLKGIIFLEEYNQNRYVFDNIGNFTTYTGMNHSARAMFFNTSKTHLVSLSPNYVVVNGFQLTEYEDGLYNLPSEYDIRNLFGGGYNRIEIEPNHYFDSLVDSVTFASAINSSISMGQIVNRNSDFIINLNGATSTSIVECILERVYDGFTGSTDWQPVDTNSSRVTGTAVLQQNTGNIVIPQSRIETLKTGYYILIIRAYEPKYVPLRCGGEICVVGESTFETTVYINQ